MSSQTKSSEYYVLDNEKVKNYLTPIAILVSGLFISLSFVFGSFMMKENSTSNVNSSACTAEAPLSASCLQKYAEDLKLNEKKFSSCLTDKKYDDKITASVDYANTVGVQGTPSLFLAKTKDGKTTGFYAGGTLPYDTLKILLDYAEKNSLEATLSFWKQNQLDQLVGYETQVADYYKSAQGGSLVGDALTAAVKTVMDSRRSEIETTFKIQDISLEGALIKGKGDTFLVEFSDFECPYCKQLAQETLSKVETDYVAKDKLALAFFNFPLEQIHKDARSAANAALCADEQGKFFEYHDKLFAVDSK